MNDRVFDLTVPVTRQSRIFFRIAGVLYVVGGVLWLFGGKLLPGIVMLAAGLLNLASSFIMTYANRYVIAFKDDGLEISRGYFKSRMTLWETVTRINVQLMFVDLVLAGGQSRRVGFDTLDYCTHQEIKPKIIAAFREFAKAKQIPLSDGYEPALETVSMA